MGIYIVAVIFFGLICLVIFFAELYRRNVTVCKAARREAFRAREKAQQTEFELVRTKSELGRMEIKIENYRKVLESLRGCHVDSESIDKVNVSVFTFANENMGKVREMAAKALEDN